MTQLLFWMLIPFAFMAIALIDAFVRTHRLEEHASMRELIQSAVMQATPIMLWISFLAYSVVSTTAFDAFQCYRFGLEGSEGSWLRADVSVRCGGKEHEAIERVAWVAIAIWPFGAIFAASALSFFAHLGRVYNNPELARPKLRQAISFLHIEYKPDFWWWEPLPMLLRLILVGFFVLIEPGSMTQLVLGTLTTLFFLLIQMQASPYVSMVDTYLAVSCNASLVVFFVCCIVFNIISFTELDKVQGVMTIDLETLYNTPVLALTVGMFICLLFSLFLKDALLDRAAHVDGVPHGVSARALAVTRKAVEQPVVTVAVAVCDGAPADEPAMDEGPLVPMAILAHVERRQRALRGLAVPGVVVPPALVDGAVGIRAAAGAAPFAPRLARRGTRRPRGKSMHPRRRARRAPNRPCTSPRRRGWQCQSHGHPRLPVALVAAAGVERAVGRMQRARAVPPIAPPRAFIRIALRAVHAPAPLAPVGMPLVLILARVDTAA